MIKPAQKKRGNPLAAFVVVHDSLTDCPINCQLAIRGTLVHFCQKWWSIFCQSSRLTKWHTIFHYLSHADATLRLFPIFNYLPILDLPNVRLLTISGQLTALGFSRSFKLVEKAKIENVCKLAKSKLMNCMFDLTWKCRFRLVAFCFLFLSLSTK